MVQAQPFAPAAAMAPRWYVPPEDFARLGREALLCSLDELGVLQIEGPDALNFAQTQFTADLAALSPSAWQLGGYCTPKGRLLCTFQAWRSAEGLGLVLPVALLPSIRERLSRYVLRAKVQLREAAGTWRVFGLCAPDPSALPDGAGAAPSTLWQAAPLQELGRIARLPAGAQGLRRWICVLPASRVPAWLESMPAVPLISSGLWWWSQIDAALPEVFSGTSECFVPQTLHLEVLGAVSFRKGCYPGQEVVARSQYLGKSRRRMSLAHAEELGDGSDVFADDHSEPVGRIVMAAQAPHGGWDLLFESGPQPAATVLRAGSRAAPPLRLRSLPYELVDSTAT